MKIETNLTGTPKQITWAVDIKAEWLDILTRNIEQERERQVNRGVTTSKIDQARADAIMGEVREVCDRVRERIAGMTNAAEIIEARGWTSLKKMLVAAGAK